MTQRMTCKRVERKQNNIQHQNQRAQSHTEVPIKPKRANGVVPENNQKDQSNVQKVAMQVLQYKRESSFTLVAVWTHFANRARRRIKKERTVVSFAVVVTRGAESERRPENQNRGRERPPAWPNQRRVKRRKVRTPFVVTIFKCPPRRIDAERSKHDDDRD